MFTGVFMCFLVGFYFYKKFKNIQNESIKESIQSSTFNFPLNEGKTFNKDSLFNFSYKIQDSIFYLKEEQNKKVLIINFWATWCKPCIEEMPYLDSLKTFYKNNSEVKFICLSDELPEKVKIFKSKINFTLPFATYNKNQVLPKELVVESLPTTILFNLKTNTYFKYEGSLNWNSIGAKNFINSQINN